MTDPTSPTASPDEARAIAAEAYVYAYPMLDNYATWFKQAVDPEAPEYVGGFGRFRHYSEPSTPQNHDVVTPNNDTPYSRAWLDLRAEPWGLSVPDVPSGRAQRQTEGTGRKVRSPGRVWAPPYPPTATNAPFLKPGLP